jgi:DNA methylase
MIYIDPPYGIRYGSNFQPFVNKRDVKDGKDEDLTQEPEMIRAFRDTWELGIHSYLTYLRDRLLLTRDLLNESGSIFVQISDENVHRVRGILDEVFGPKNFVSQISFRKTSNLTAEFLPTNSDFLLWFGTIESGGNEKIAMWMLDTDYDGRSLLPRQVFFPMAGENAGWSRLARNLKAEIDEELIEAYRGTVSLPFEPGKNKRVAVKIVDDRGIESLRILDIA